MSLKKLTLDKNQRQSGGNKYFFIHKLLIILKILLNPSHKILTNLFGITDYRQDADLRKPQSFKFGGWQIIHFFRITIVVLLDSLMFFVAWTIADNLLIFNDQSVFFQLTNNQLGLFVTVIVTNLAIFYSSRLYGIDRSSRSYGNLFKSISLAHFLLLIQTNLISYNIDLKLICLAWLLSIVLVIGERFSLNFAIDMMRKKIPELRRNVLLLGIKKDTDLAKNFLETYQNFNVVQVINLSSSYYLNNSSQLLEKVNLNEVDEVFICSWEYIKNPIPLLWELNCAGISWRVMPVWLNLPLQWSDIGMIDDVPTFRFNSAAIIGVDFWCKRLFDLIASLLLLLVLSIPMLVSAILIKLDSPGPIFYKQTRVGLKGKHFQVWKFRTMVQNASELQKELEAKNEVQGGVLFKIKDDPRITKVGKFLRRYSLDELPQLFNVLQGEMSLVGPRPLPVRDVEKFSQHHFFRHEVLPGITGLWQVSGRSDIEDSEEVFNLDFAYIKNWSLSLDLKILLQTFQAVLTSKGAY